MKLLGVEDTVTAGSAFGKCLRIVLKGIGRSFGSLVDNGQHTAFFHQVELYASSLPLDRTRLNISGDAQAKRMRLLRNFGYAGYDSGVDFGTNAKMTELSAAMGLVALEGLPARLQATRERWGQ